MTRGKAVTNNSLIFKSKNRNGTGSICWVTLIVRAIFSVRVVALAFPRHLRGSVKGPIRTSSSFLIMTFRGSRLPSVPFVSINCLSAPYFHGGNTGFQRKGFIPDRCAVSYLLEESSFAVAREKTILIRSERLGKDKD